MVTLSSRDPRRQLPYLEDNGNTIGDGNAIIAHLKHRFRLSLDDELDAKEMSTDLLLRRTLDDLHWVMSYSRWSDVRFWRSFRDALLAEHQELTTAVLESARRYNFERYRYQGIGRYEREAVYERGLADLRAITHFLGDGPFLFGAEPSSANAGLYGFIASIYFYEIDTPLKRFVVAQENLVNHCEAMRDWMRRRLEGLGAEGFLGRCFESKGRYEPDEIQPVAWGTTGACRP